MTSTTTPAAKPTAAMLKRYQSLVDFNDRTTTVAARERNRKAWKALEEQCKARGLSLTDLIS